MSIVSPQELQSATKEMGRIRAQVAQELEQEEQRECQRDRDSVLQRVFREMRRRRSNSRTAARGGQTQ